MHDLWLGICSRDIYRIVGIEAIQDGPSRCHPSLVTSQLHLSAGDDDSRVFTGIVTRRLSSVGLVGWLVAIIRRFV